MPPGEEARIVVAAVDVGILNLTNYKPPAPDDYYLGQRRLTAEIRDLYGQLIDGMQGTRGQIRTGGDGGGGRWKARRPRRSRSRSIPALCTVKRDGTAEVLFDIPAFAGTARVMAVAWSQDKVGKATGDVTIRDPVVLTATLPRFLLTGDNAARCISISTMSKAPAGDYAVAVTATGAAYRHRTRAADTDARCQAAQRRVGAAVGQRRPARRRQCEGHRPGRLHARAQLTRSMCSRRRRCWRAAR